MKEIPIVPAPIVIRRGQPPMEFTVKRKPPPPPPEGASHAG
jgi:hypothetical protein